MNITNYYEPSQGVSVISPSGLQKYTEKLNSFTQVYSSVYTSKNNNKHAIDSCWESGNVYYASYDTGYIKKVGFDGTEWANLDISNALSVSAIQYADKMSNPVTYPPQQDRGCWIVERASNTLIKTDGELNVLFTYVGLGSPYCVVSDVDGGCVVYDSSPKAIYKFDADAKLVCSKTFASFVPIPTVFQDMAIDTSGNVWVLASDVVYNFSVVNFSFVLNFVLDPINDIGPAVVGDLEHVGSIDVDRNSGSYQYLYVAGGNDEEAWVIKYNSTGALIDSQRYSNFIYPYVTKCVQGYGGSTVYLLSDPEKWDELGYGSSSSSSSYIDNWSSSSSSSSNSSSSSSSSA